MGLLLIVRPDKSSLHRLFGRKFKDLSPEDQGDLGARLNGRWVHAIVRSVREILRNEDLSDKDKVRALLKFVIQTGLQMPEAPKPLPAVRIDDIRVNTWMAVASVNQKVAGSNRSLLQQSFSSVPTSKHVAL